MSSITNLCNPIFSFVVPAKNAEKTIVKTIDSVIGQTMQNWELVIVDDGSTDSTAKIVDSYSKKDSRIKLVKAHGLGCSGGRYLAMQHSRGQWFCRLDADDWIEATYLAELEAFIESHPGFDIYSVNGYFVDSEGCLQPYYPDEMHQNVVSFNIDDLLTYGTLFGPGAIVRPSLIKDIGGLRSHIRSEDADIWHRALAAGKTHIHYPGYLYYYRRSDLQMTSSLEAVWLSHIEIVQDLLRSKVLKKNSIILAEERIRFLASLFKIEESDNNWCDLFSKYYSADLPKESIVWVVPDIQRQYYPILQYCSFLQKLGATQIVLTESTQLKHDVSQEKNDVIFSPPRCGRVRLQRKNDKSLLQRVCAKIDRIVGWRVDPFLKMASADNFLAFMFEVKLFVSKTQYSICIANDENTYKVLNKMDVHSIRKLLRLSEVLCPSDEYNYYSASRILLQIRNSHLGKEDELQKDALDNIGCCAHETENVDHRLYVGTVDIDFRVNDLIRFMQKNENASVCIIAEGALLNPLVRQLRFFGLETRVFVINISSLFASLWFDQIVGWATSLDDFRRFEGRESRLMRYVDLNSLCSGSSFM